MKKYLLLEMITKNINNRIFIPLLILSLLLQFTFIPQLFSGLATPNLALMLLIAASFLCKSADMFYAAFFSGIILDIFAGTNFGFITISILFSVFLSTYLGNSFLKELFSFRSLLISFAVIVLYNIIYFLLINIENYHLAFANLNYLFLVIASNLVYSIFFTYPILRLISSRR